MKNGGILMIVDELKNARLYAGVMPDFMGALEYAMSLENADCGRYEYGDHYVMIQQGETRSLEGADLEAHRRYVDVQIVLSGAERVGYAPLSSLKITQDYDAQKDMLLAEGEAGFIDIRKGMFYLLFPGDAHAPCGHPGTPSSFKKAVVKIRL